VKASTLKPGDLVAVNIRGTHFEATVTGRDAGRVLIEPTYSAFGFKSATARQIVRLLARPGRRAAA
jgi:prophage tail gpP-like protein